MLPLRSNLALAVDQGSFWWAVGIEDSFIADPWHRTGRSLDEYELTDHYQRWQGDLDLVRALGVRVMRYGLPWHRIAPGPQQRDWSWCDRVMERLRDCGIEPILDLVHYGLPGWLNGAYLAPDFPRRMADHAAEVAQRYSWVRWFTPMNEPRIAAWYCGRLGWWPPYRASWRGFVAVLMAACRGIVASARAIRQVRPEAVIAHVDASDLFVAADERLLAVSEHRQQLVFLALDLIFGRVVGDHPLHGWLLDRGVTEADLDWFRLNASVPDVIGVNLYPMFTLKRLELVRDRVHVRMPYATGELLEQVIEQYRDRYRLPLFVSETASRGAVVRRQRWLADSVAAVARLRDRGIPVLGYTWWPLFGLVAWSYRQGTRALDTYIQQFGLWDLRRDANGELARLPTDVAEDFRALVSHGSAAVGSYRKR